MHLNLKAKHSGQILIISLIFLFITIMLIGVFLSSTSNFLSFFNRSLANESAKQLSEAGLAHAIAQLNVQGAISSLPYNATFSYGSGEIKYTVESSGAGGVDRQITSSGFVPNSTNPKGKWTVQAVTKLISGSSVNFSYAVQAGSNGISMNNMSSISGNAYSGGNIMGSGASITGNASACGTVYSPPVGPTVSGTSQSGVSPCETIPPLDYAPAQSAADANPQSCTPGQTVIISTSQTIGPAKYNCNLQITGLANVVVNVKGSIHVTGTFTMTNYPTLQVDPSLGSSGTWFIVDGTTTTGADAKIYPTNTYPTVGYLLFYHPYSTPNAFSIYGDARAVFYTVNGTATVYAQAHTIAVYAKGITLGTSANLTFDSGLAQANFVGGGGSWQIKKGTYQSTKTPLILAAVYNSTYRTPTCTSVGAGCDSGNLLNGRDNVSSMVEANAPNTTDTNCYDDTVAGQNSIENIKVYTQNGTSTFKAGATPTTVLIKAKGNFNGSLQGVVNFYYKNATSTPPYWTIVGTTSQVELNSPEDVGSFEITSQAFQLTGSAGFHAVRAQFRDHIGQAASCTWSGIGTDTDESDDLVFNVG